MWWYMGVIDEQHVFSADWNYNVGRNTDNTAREKRSHLLEIPPASVSSGANVSSPLVHGTDGFARARGLDGCHDPGHWKKKSND